MNWTVEQVNAFAPDVGTAKRGKGIAKLNKWIKLEKTNRAIWGECKGSGSKPYLTGVDLNGTAFKCSCPVRKPPCKHVMGLMLLYVQSFNEFKDENPPTWMSEWLTKRDAKAVKVEKIADKPIDDDEYTKAINGEIKRFQKRISDIKKGLPDFETWLLDLIRQGIASVEKQPYGFWKDASARLSDTKAQNASYVFQEIPLLINAHPTWFEDVLSIFSNTYLLNQAIHRIDLFPKTMQYDLLRSLGYNISKNNLFLLNSKSDKYKATDEWEVLGRIAIPHPVNESLLIQRYWLRGKESGKSALIYEPIFKLNAFEYRLNVGSFFKGEVIFYPSGFPLRAHISKQIPSTGFIQDLKGAPNFQTFLKDFSIALAINPWISEFPCALDNIKPAMQDGKLILIDKENQIVPVMDRDLIGWKLLALSGGTPISIFGEWTGKELIPLSAIVNERFINMSVNRISNN